MKDMKIVQEMYARGFEFMPARHLQGEGKDVPDHRRKTDAVPCKYRRMGDKAAEAVEEASKDGPYLSLDDFRSGPRSARP